MAQRSFDGRPRVIVDGVEHTTFMLAVQETNFLYSFTLSAVSALATALSDQDFSTGLSVALLLVSIIYSVYGIVVAVILYGRKTTHEADTLQRDTVIYKSMTSNQLTTQK